MLLDVGPIRADEFVKLYAYTITSHWIRVHIDINFMYHAPMDDLYDAMLLSSKSGGGEIGTVED